MLCVGPAAGLTAVRFLVDEKNEITTISTWFSVEDWKAWFETDERKKIQSSIDAIPGVTTQYAIYRYIKTI